MPKDLQVKIFYTDASWQPESKKGAAVVCNDSDESHFILLSCETSHQAELKSVELAVQKAQELELGINDKCVIKNDNQPAIEHFAKLYEKIPNLEFVWIPREQNEKANNLARFHSIRGHLNGLKSILPGYEKAEKTQKRKENLEKYLNILINQEKYMSEEQKALFSEIKPKAQEILDGFPASQQSPKTTAKSSKKTSSTNNNTKTTQTPSTDNSTKTPQTQSTMQTQTKSTQTTQTPTKTLENTINIYTDGSLRKAEGVGVGGWSFLIESKTHTIMSNGVLFCDSNNLAELMAVIKALQTLEKFKVQAKVFIYTDSQYVIDRIKEKTKIKEYNNNWAILKPLLEKYEPDISWVKGHNGHEQNELCDKMAGEVTKSFTKAKPQDLAKAKLDKDLENETSEKLAQLTSQNLDETLANETSEKLAQLASQNLDETLQSFSGALKNFAHNLTQKLNSVKLAIDKNINYVGELDNIIKNLKNP